MVLPQYDELTSEDDDGAPPFASEYDAEESREAYQRAAYREAIAHFLPLPRTSYFLEPVARACGKRQAKACGKSAGGLSWGDRDLASQPRCYLSRFRRFRPDADNAR